MDERLVKAARDGDVNTLHSLMEGDPEILERASSAHFVDSALHVAALYGRVDFVEQIVTLMPSLATETNQQGMIPLHLASLKGHVETVRELLKAKLDDDGVNHQCLVKDDEGWTPLHCASQKGKIRVMEELIRACPVCLEQVTAKGETVVHLAVKANQFGAVKVLADRIRHHNLQKVLKAQDQKGKSAYQLAAAKKQLQVLEVLKEDEEEEGGEIREESRINMESESEASKKEESDELKSQEDAMLVVATLIITLTYQALASPPSTLFKEGSITIDWSCVLSGRKQRSLDLRNILKDCPAVLPFSFLMFNTLIFIQSILVVVFTLRGRKIFPVQLLTVYLILCYSILLTAVNHNIVYFSIPIAMIVVLAFFIIILKKRWRSNTSPKALIRHVSRKMASKGSM